MIMAGIVRRVFDDFQIRLTVFNLQLHLVLKSLESAYFLQKGDDVYLVRIGVSRLGKQSLFSAKAAPFQPAGGLTVVDLVHLLPAKPSLLVDEWSSFIGLFNFAPVVKFFYHIVVKLVESHQSNASAK